MFQNRDSSAQQHSVDGKASVIPLWAFVVDTHQRNLPFNQISSAVCIQINRMRKGMDSVKTIVVSAQQNPIPQLNIQPFQVCSLDAGNAVQTEYFGGTAEPF